MSESKDSELPFTRRRVLKSAVVATGVGYIALESAVFAQSRTRTRDGGGRDNDGDAPVDNDQADRIASPHTTPFVVPLPVYGQKQPVPLSALNPAPTKNAGPEEAGRLPHQAWDRWSPQEFYEVRVREADHSFHPELPTQKIWGYDGLFPGPTFQVRHGRPMLVRFHNDLPLNHVGFGTPEISTHVHNAHAPSESDGFPGDYYSRQKKGPTLSRPGRYKDQHYPNFCAGQNDIFFPQGDSAEALGTMWYHDHREDFTAANVYKGLAGFFIYTDELDSCDEKDPNPKALRLPSGLGVYDIPLLFDDKKFDSSGYLYFNQFDPEGTPGDKFCVNGKVQPFFEVERRKYRFRMLDGSLMRFFEFYLTYNGVDQSFTHIANDGNLLPAPLTVNNVRITPAQREDIIIDFSKYPIGSKLYLVNRLEQLNGRGPTNLLLSPGTQIMRFDVAREPAQPDTSRVPAILRPPRPINLGMVRRNREMRLDRENDLWTIDGKSFDAEKTAFTVRRGDLEVWTFKNSSGWSHPLHMHLEEGVILSRNGLPPPPHERGRKDVFELRPGEEIKIAIRFRDYVGKYVLHCHNLIHEDHHMMVRFDVER